MNAKPAIRVLLVDDNPQFLAVLASFLATTSQLKIVGQALSGQDGLVQVAQLQPDLVLLDLNLPDINGLEVIRCLKAQPYVPHIIVLTLHNIREYRVAAEAAGAADFVLKEEVATLLLPAIYALFQILPASETIKPVDRDGL